MIIVMKPSATKTNIENVSSYIKSLGLNTHISQGKSITIIGVIGDKKLVPDTVRLFSGVDKLVHLTEGYKLVNRKFFAEPTTVNIGNVKCGADTLTVAAGPCCIESAEQMLETAEEVEKAGGTLLRCGEYFPDTAEVLSKIKAKTKLKLVVEVKLAALVQEAAKYADVLLIGSSNMENKGILKECAATGKPVILCRSIAATIDELLTSAEYIMTNGNGNIILCERGIRTYETATRYTLDLSAIPVIKSKSHLPVLADPSHAAYVMEYVKPLSKAATAAGADGLIIEIHKNPGSSATQGSQALSFKEFNDVMQAIRPIAHLEKRKF